MIAAIDRTRQVQTSITWTAPRDGVILERNAVQGMKASPGDVLFRREHTRLQRRLEYWRNEKEIRKD